MLVGMELLLALVTQTMVPMWLFVVAMFCLGAIIGSFLNVYIYRFHTGKSLNGSSHCLSCAKRLHWYELFPLLSYVALRGRCRGCGSWVPLRYFVVELTTALLFVAGLLVVSSVFELICITLMMTILVVIMVYDYYHFIIPDELTIAATVLMAGWLGVNLWSDIITLQTLLWTVGASFAGAGFFFLLWFVSKGQWLGFGDVKLAVPLGLFVGPGAVFSFVVLSFWIGAIVSLIILGWQKWQRGQRRLHLSQETLTMKSAVPFAPFMIAGALAVYITHFDALSLFSFI